MVIYLTNKRIKHQECNLLLSLRLLVKMLLLVIIYLKVNKLLIHSDLKKSNHAILLVNLIKYSLNRGSDRQINHAMLLQIHSLYNSLSMK